MAAGYCSGTPGLSPHFRFASSFGLAYGDREGCHFPNSDRAVSYSVADRVGSHRAAYVFQCGWLSTYSGQIMAKLFEGLVDRAPFKIDYYRGDVLLCRGSNWYRSVAIRQRKSLGPDPRH